MVEQSQGDAAPAAPPLGILGMQVSSSGVWFDLNGVSLSVVGMAFNYPAQADPNHPENQWPTSMMAFGKLVLMQDGAQWRMWRPVIRQADGSLQVSLRPLGSTNQATFNVSPADVDKPLWNLGTELPPIILPEPTPDPDAPTDPIPPQTPGGGDTNQPPAEPPQEPVEP